MMNQVRFEGNFSINGYRQAIPLTLTAEVPLFDEYLEKMESYHAIELLHRDRRIAELESEVSRLRRRRRWRWRRGGKS
jgi:hypothetical protein